MTKNRPRILIIDDDTGTIELLTHKLSMEGYVVISAQNGKDGLAKASKVKPAVCILDIKLPGMNGTEVLGKLKELDPNLEVIMATAHADIETVDVSLRKNAFDYLLKPFDIEYLVSMIKRALENQKLQE